MNKYRDASNRLTYDFDDIQADQYPKITSLLAKQFNLKPSGKLIVGLDEIFQDYEFGDFVIGLEWDIWSGYSVNAKNQDSEPLVREIAEFINEKYI